MEVVKRYLRYSTQLAHWFIKQPFKNKKVEAISMLLSSDTFRHACKTPMSVLLCNLESAMDTEANREIFRSSFLAAKNLSLILGNLENPKAQSGVVFDVGETIKQVVILVNSKFPGTKIEYKVREALITGNKLLFQESIQCLLVNAIEAQIDGVNARPLVIIRERIINHDLLRIDVIDFGKGMSLAELRLASLRGISYKKSGTGLGLSFAIEAIEQVFGGKICISSAVGMGTRIKMEIPI